MLNPYRLKELTLFDFYHSLTSLKSLAFIIPYFLFWFLFFDNLNELAVENLKSAQGLFVASWLLQDQDLVLQMFVDRSASLSLYLIVSLTVAPLFILLAANNQYSSDASRGAFRFILTRATRMELYISRFIAVSLLVLLCIFLTSLWASVLAFLNEEETPDLIITYGLQTFTIVCFYNLPFIAFMSMVSAFARSTFGCLCLGMMLYVFLIVLSLWLKSDIQYASYLIPSGVKSFLLNINPENIFISVAALCCYTLVYFVCGWNIFKRRDM
ncbi:MAG: ABC transporter permease subunit [Proteobacteria bacterium]|nr:ABC transporter permease subunit [Pseudomonadota bacterium]